MPTVRLPEDFPGDPERVEERHLVNFLALVVDVGRTLARRLRVWLPPKGGLVGANDRAHAAAEVRNDASLLEMLLDGAVRLTDPGAMPGEAEGPVERSVRAALRDPAKARAIADWLEQFPLLGAGVRAVLVRYVSLGFTRGWFDSPAPGGGLEVTEVALAGLEGALDALDEAVRHCRPVLGGDPAQAGVVIVSLGGHRYRVAGGPTVLVTHREDTVLEAFIGRENLDKPTLATLSGYDGEMATAVLRSLRGTRRRPAKYGGMFSAAITTPGRRGAGSYRVCIVRSDGP
jgi:hypothetical protein